MQIKPATARGVGGDEHSPACMSTGCTIPRSTWRSASTTCCNCLRTSSIDGDLIRLAGRLRPGPFGLKRWADSVNDQGDPLLFLEAIPNPATRMFIQDILAWSWHYAAVFELPAASLDALAAGHFPRLVGIAAQPMDIAAAVCGGMAALP